LKISPYSYNIYVNSKANKKNETSFTSTKEWDKNISHQTNFFRPDLDWKKTVDYITKEMPNDIHIYNFACSDGSEPYSLAMMLKDKLGNEKAEKYFPIKAFDITKKVIDKAKEGIIGITEVDNPESSMDVNLLEMNIKANYKDYFKKLPSDKYPDEQVGTISTMYNDIPVYAQQHKVSEELRSAVDFEVADITKASRNPIYDKPSVVFFRNAWRYLDSDATREQLTNNLFNNLKKGSIVLVGDAEKFDGDTKLLENAGFQPVESLENVYKKTY